MKTELIVIGNEVLSGHTVNTNLAFIGKILDESGYSLMHETVILDDRSQIILAMREALDRSDIVISTGGLGPTLDDVTRLAAAELFDSSFHVDQTVLNQLKIRFGDRLSTVEDQATVPKKARVLLNKVGTAPGLIFEENGKTLILMPGVPNEMHPMLEEQVVPFIQKQYPISSKFHRRALQIFEVCESNIDSFVRKIQPRYPDIQFGIYPGLGIVSVTLAVKAANQSEADELLHKPYQELETFFATNCFESKNGSIEEAVHHLFTEKGWTLSCAESCTGGALSARITAQPGASVYFLGSIVCYANSVKSSVLEIPDELIEDKGAVSKEVVSAMAEGVLKVSGSDFAVAVSGIAGPSGGSSEKPVGTVWCAVSHRRGKPHVWKLDRNMPRHMVITWSINSLLSNLLTYSKQYNV